MNGLLKISVISILLFSWGLTTIKAQSGDVITNEYPEEKVTLIL